jgi:glycosyltransferase involved in cell wall biosynthesis
MATPYRIAIVIPAYNEALRLPETLKAIATHSVEGFSLVNIIVADNASVDDTGEVALTYKAQLNLPLTVHRLAVAGKASTLREMMPVACAPEVDGVLFMDADNATDINQLSHFDFNDRQSIQIASRYLPESTIVTAKGGKRGWSREILSWVMRRMTQVLLGLPEKDTQCGFKLFPNPAVKPLFENLTSRSWVFDAEILAQAHRMGLTVKEIPVYWVEMPGSKVKPVQDSFKSFIALWQIKWALRRNRPPRI